jgi:nondiscriminating aspartyl-tRNA synthetase
MINRIKIKDVQEHVGKEINIAGFVHSLRDQSKIAFINIRDISGMIQVVVLNDCSDFEKVKDLPTESFVVINGLVKEEKQAPSGFELEARSIEILSKADPELAIPVETRKGGEETNVASRFDYRWLDIRKPRNTEIFKVWTALEKGMRKYFDEAEFIQVYTPSFMSSASETGADVFEVQYFEKKAYLAQSPQFYKQMAIASGLERVFISGPVFRAEQSFTTRHMTEFTGWDFEVGLIESHHDLMDIEEKMIVNAFEQVKEDVDNVEIEIPKTPFPRISMKEAKEKLKDAGIKSGEEHDLSPEEERGICKIIKEETGNDFVFITDYHISKRPFYHMRHEDNPELTKSADLLYKGLEITTLAQREHRVDVLKEQAIEKEMDLEELSDYMSFFKYGCPPHGGGGIGPARLIMRLLELDSVKEATFLPRDVNRLTP